jgi:hypothetical protein
MLYERVPPMQPVPALRISEPPMRYRRRGRSPGRKAPARAEPPTEQIELRVRARDHGVRWQRIMALNKRVSAALQGDVRSMWLTLEESLHEHWLEVALEHYESGLKAGLAQAFDRLEHPDPCDLRTRLQVVASALAGLIRELEERDHADAEPKRARPRH